MNKQTQMYIGVGVVAIAGYFLLKSMKPKKAFLNLLAPAPDCSQPGTTGCGCPPKNGARPIGTANDGTQLYPNGHVCCGTASGPCPPGGTHGGTKDKGFVGDNSKVFKGDKSFVGDNSRVFKGDKSFVGDNSRVFKGDM